MKKTFALYLALLLAISAYADTVSRSGAESLAGKFLGVEASSLTMVTELSGEETKSSQAPLLYAFNRQGGGWVIVAGDDLLAPILGYSDSGSIGERIPSNLKAYFRNVSNNLDRARKAGLVPSARHRARWANVSGEHKASSGKLLQTANWGQDSPFNDKCPKISGESGRSVTGCVATAMAIVLRYHRWPAHGSGTLDSYTTGTAGYKVNGFDISGHNYDWTLPLNYSGSWTSAQKTSVAQLMYDLGVMVQMDYSCNGSGAWSSDIIPALFKHMSYDGSAMELYRYNYSNAEWFAIIRKEIDANRPIIYGGSDYDTEDGHQFVVDGYDANDNIHINWGWNGNMNGYYAVNYIGDKDSDGVDDVFNFYDSAIIGLKKDNSGTSSEGAPLFMFAYDGYEGISLKSGDPASGQTFTLSVGCISNNSYSADFDRKIRPVLVDWKGNLKEVIGNEKAITVEKIDGEYICFESTDLQCRISSGAVPGDAVEVQFLNTDGNWWKIGAEMNVSELYGYISGDTPSIASLGVFDAAFIRIPESLHAGQTLYFELVPGRRIPSEINWKYDGKSAARGTAVLSGGNHTISASISYTDGSKENLSATISVTQ